MADGDNEPNSPSTVGGLSIKNPHNIQTNNESVKLSNSSSSTTFNNVLNTSNNLVDDQSQQQTPKPTRNNSCINMPTSKISMQSSHQTTNNHHTTSTTSSKSINQNHQPKNQQTAASNQTQVSKRNANDYIFGKTIGEGSFSTVYLAKEIKTNHEFAIKVCDKSHIIKEKKIAYIIREKEALNILSNTSPYFVKLYCTFHDERQLFFVLTYARNGDLQQLLNRLDKLDLSVAHYYTCQLVLALEVLKHKGIIHRDLKPENILLDDNMNILITDFGSTKIIKPEDETPHTSSSSTSSTSSTDTDDEDLSTRRRTSFVGTANYVSPEVLMNKPMTHACDLWALGCIVYRMLAGKLCFTAESDFLIFKKILNRKYDYPENFPNVASDLIDNLLVIDSDQRLGATDLVPYTSIRSHPFFETITWSNHVILPTEMAAKLRAKRKSESTDNCIGDNENCFDKAEPGLNQKQIARLLSLNMDGSEQSIIFNELPSSEPVEKSIFKEKHVEQKSIADVTPNELEFKLSQQRKSNKFHDLVEGNLILKQGLIEKKKGLLARRRMFLLTLGPHLYYVDPTTKVLKGQIPWTEHLRIEIKNFKKFEIHTPNRIYYLEDTDGYALEWRDCIEDVHKFYFSRQRQ